MPSFAQKASRDGSTLFLVRGGKDFTRQPAWYFVQVEPAKVRAFHKAVAGGNMNLESFGTVVESGYGDEPPPAILSYMRAEYSYAG